jgi:hypothetical protein
MGVGDLGIAFDAVAHMGVGYDRGVNCGFGLIDATSRFESSNTHGLVCSHQPVAGGHWGAIVQQRGIAHDDGITIARAHDDGKITAGRAAEQFDDACRVATVLGIRRG